MVPDLLVHDIAQLRSLKNSCPSIRILISLQHPTGHPTIGFPALSATGASLVSKFVDEARGKTTHLDRTLHDSPRMVIPASYPLEHGRGNPDFQWEDHVKIFKMDIDGGFSIARSVLLRGSGLGSHGPTHHGCKPLAAISSRINDPRLLRGVSNGVNQKISKK